MFEKGWFHQTCTEIYLLQFSHSGSTPVMNVTCSKEVILASGAIFSPTILQLSGIGPEDVLKSLDIPVKVYVHSTHREWIALHAQGMMTGVVVIVKVVSYTYFVKVTYLESARTCKTMGCYILYIHVCGRSRKPTLSPFESESTQPTRKPPLLLRTS